MLIEIDNVELDSSKGMLLKGIYLKAQTGKITGILGSNGCGKSSLLNILFGSITPKNRLVRIDGKPFLKPLYTYGVVKYLPQDNFIPTHLKISRVFRLYQVSWEDFIKDFENLADLKDVTIKEISGGERRLMEAYLIVKSNAQIILLDEPFTHLSPVYIEKFTKILKSEAKGKAIIITDHLYKHIIHVADELYFLTNGCTQLIKDPAELENLKYLNLGTL